MYAYHRKFIEQENDYETILNNTDPQNKLYEAVKKNDYKTVHLIWEKISQTIEHCSKSLIEECQISSNRMKEAWSKLINWEYVMQMASELGNMEIVQMAIRQGAHFWDECLLRACQNNQLSIAQKLIDRGASNFNEALEYACRHKHIQCVHFLVHQGANDWNLALRGACESGDQTLIDLCIQNGANQWTKGLQGACMGGHVNIMLQMVDHHVDGNGANNFMEEAMYCAGVTGNREMVDALERIGIRQWKSGLAGALCGDHPDLILYFIKEKGVDDTIGILQTCNLFRHSNVVKYILESKKPFHVNNALYQDMHKDINPIQMVCFECGMNNIDVWMYRLPFFLNRGVNEKQFSPSTLVRVNKWKISRAQLQRITLSMSKWIHVNVQDTFKHLILPFIPFSSPLTCSR